MARVSKKLLYSVILLCAATPDLCQNLTENSTDVNSGLSAITVENTTTIISEPQESTYYNYLVQLIFDIDENKVPESLVNVIFTERSNNTINTITADDIQQLYQLRNMSLSSSIEVLAAMGIKPSNVLSIDGLEAFLDELDIEFRAFYRQIFEVRLNISGIALRNFLISLGINSNDFTSAVTYNDPHPFEEFKKGNFSQTSLEKALNGTGRTVEDLFVACREELLSRASAMPTDQLLEILEEHEFTQTEALRLWRHLNLTMVNVQDIPVFANILSETVQNLNANSFLGVLGEGDISINKKVYDTWKQQPMAEMYAQSLYENVSRKVEDLVHSQFGDIFVLKLNGTYGNTAVERVFSSEDVKNCTFITLRNGSVVEENIEVARFIDQHFEITSNISRNGLIPVGSPLICSNKVYGLAIESQENTVLFDVFRKNVAVSNGLITIFNKNLVIVVALGFYLSY